MAQNCRKALQTTLCGLPERKGVTNMILPPQVNRAFDLLGAAGYEAFLVGGAVRDYVRCGCSAKDWDITTNAFPEQIKAVFRDYPVLETGLKHGTVTVIMDHLPLEITTYRVDGGYSDHRHPDSVRFTRSLREDLARRDFTMNALAYHPSVGIVDLVGGQEDIAHGRIRCVGDPERRFQEDALRMLRALRFASVFGMKLEDDAAEAVRRNGHLLRDVAAERVQGELTKMLCGAGVGDVLRDFAHVIAVPIPELTPMFGFDQKNPHHDKDVWGHTVSVTAHIQPEPVLRWSALLHDIGKPSCFTLAEDGVGHFYGHAKKSADLAETILKRLKLDRASQERIISLVRGHDQPLSAEKKAVRRLLNKYGPETVRQMIELHRADTLGQSARCMSRLADLERVSAVVEEILEEDGCFSLRDLAVNGRDMLALGKRGKAVGLALEKCLSAVMDERVPNERKALLDFAATLPESCL
jgi:tRNA nucleotidyltransferase (CCA-adding enzyme)